MRPVNRREAQAALATAALAILGLAAVVGGFFWSMVWLCGGLS